MPDAATRPAQCQALAELIVSDVGVNLQAGQVVGISAEPGQEEIWRAVAEAAYRRGARFVDPWIFDPYVKHARLTHAPVDTLGYRPPWWGDRYRALGECAGAQIRLAGSAAPALMEDIPGARLAHDLMPRVPEFLEVVHARSWNWIAAPGPSAGWAERVYPDLGRDAALDRLWQEISFLMRLDAPDPRAAWRARFAELVATASRLDALGLDSLHFVGPGTDLAVGLLPGSIWRAAWDETVGGLRFAGNLPTEEIYTAPDPARVDGYVTATKPLAVGGATVHGLALSFDHGRAVAVNATQGAELVATMIAADSGASRLGEVALVDGAGRVGQLGTVFSDTLLDENSASHLALGAAYPDTVEGTDSLAAINQSSIHADFRIGSEAVTVTGVTSDGTRVPLLRGGAWQFGA
jgi:aminopeptidase